MFEAGDGIGGTEEYIGEKSTAQSCINACLEKKMLDPEINGVTMVRCRDKSVTNPIFIAAFCFHL